MDILILILATYRLGRLLAVPKDSKGRPIPENGPYGILDYLRELVGVGYDDVGNAYGSNELARGLICIWCNSVWIGAGWALAYYLIPDVTFWLALPLALSGGAILISNFKEI